MLAQTTDSASINNTMAEEICDLLAAKNGSYSFNDCRPETMHICCICHKIALIVNAGLAELGIVAPPPPKFKESIVGMFPYADKMETILEEDKQELSGEKNVNNSSNEEFDEEHDKEELKQTMKEKEGQTTLGEIEKDKNFNNPIDFHATN
jgi:hypothetical protein